MNLEDQKRSLEALYAITSKHGQYQTLPSELAARLGMQFNVNEEWRGDRTRYPLIKELVRSSGAATVIDVGANTGFFTLSLAADLPGLKITACERNRTHADIIEILADVGEYSSVDVIDRSADLANVGSLGDFDVMLHLNILHHAGHDFDPDLVPDRNAFAEYGINYLRTAQGSARKLIFQMGYNWRGDKSLPLVAKEDQVGKFLFTRRLLEGAGWNILSVSFACKGDGDLPITYEAFRMDELPGDDSLDKWLRERYEVSVWSEFYQRPIWFCVQDRP